MHNPGSSRLSPPTLTVASLAIIALAVSLIAFRANDGSAASAVFVASTEWATWTTLAGLSVAIFAVLLMYSLRAIVRPAGDWGLAAVPARRRYGYLGVALLLLLGLTCAMWFGTEPYPAVADLPVRHMSWRTRGVITAGLAAAVPWLALVWLAHAECHDLGVCGRSLPTGGVTPGGTSEDANPFEETVIQLRRIWRLITFCIVASATSIVIAIVTAGALRNAVVAVVPEQTAFPASTVLLFGGFFAVLQAAIGMPLVVSWRARARELVDRAYPTRLGQGGDDQAADRARLEGSLHLNTPLVRDPLAALSVLAPFAVSLLAVFVPQANLG